jgi:hypothetical protein
MRMHENGWRPVPADSILDDLSRLTHGVIRGGVRLDERPKALMTKPARRNMRWLSSRCWIGINADGRKANLAARFRRRLPTGPVSRLALIRACRSSGLMFRTAHLA